MELLTLADKASLDVLYLGVYSFAGWLLEVCYRSVKQRHFVNPGFLKGPFLSIYGTFALFIIAAEQPLLQVAWEWHFIYFVVASPILEYVVGYCFWHYHHLQLWDYHKVPFNYKGFVALPFSLIWGALGLVFEHAVQPFVQEKLSTIPSYPRQGLATLFGVYLIWDVFQSFKLLRKFEQCVIQLHELDEHHEQKTIWVELRTL